MAGPLMKASLTVGVVGFIAYCYYFDKKRRSDPEFKAKLKAKRKQAKEERANRFVSDIPMFDNPNEMQEYFLQEVQKSDDFLQSGQYEEAAFHLANATVVCSSKNEFLSVMQKSLPPTVFQLLLQYYKVANEKFLKKVISESSAFKMLSTEGEAGPTQFIDNADIE